MLLSASVLVTMQLRIEAVASGLGLNQSFTPAIIDPGGRSRLQFTLLNTNPFPLANVSFTNSLPPGISVAFPKNLTNDCGSGTITTGGNVITVYGMSLGAGQTCAFALDVTCATTGFHTNAITAIYSSETGASGPVGLAVLMVTGPPILLTPGLVTNITPYSASLIGTIRLQGAATQIYLRYGTDANYGSQTQVMNYASGLDLVSASIPITGLAPGTRCYYQIVASNNLGVAFESLPYYFLTPETRPGPALSFSGTNYLLTPELTTYFSNETTTIELWFRANSAPCALVSERGQLPPAPGWNRTLLRIGTFADPNYVALWCSLPPYGQTWFWTVPIGTWHHLAFRYDKATSVFNVFLDGALGAQGTRADRAAPFESGYDLYYVIGEGAKVDVDEVRIWNVARTPQQIAANHNRRLLGTEPGLVGYWRLDEGTGNTVRDSSGHGNTASLVGEPSWILSGTTIPSPDRNLITRLDNGTIRVLFTNAPASTNTLQVSTDLITWSNLTSLTADGAGVIEFDDATAQTAPARFYRTRSP